MEYAEIEKLQAEAAAKYTDAAAAANAEFTDSMQLARETRDKALEVARSEKLKADDDARSKLMAPREKEFKDAEAARADVEKSNSGQSGDKRKL